jgi:hypothetical protein
MPFVTFALPDATAYMRNGSSNFGFGSLISEIQTSRAALQHVCPRADERERLLRLDSLLYERTYPHNSKIRMNSFVHSKAHRKLLSLRQAEMRKSLQLYTALSDGKKKKADTSLSELTASCHLATDTMWQLNLARLDEITLPRPVKSKEVTV